VSVPARRRQVAYSRGRGLSVRRACTLFSVARSALDYQSRKATRDAPVIERMKALAAQYLRFGYRRVGIFLGRDGYEMSPGRAYRLWQAAGLQVPRKRPRKRVAASRPLPRAPTEPNQVWSYDFVFDRCANGQQLKCPTVTDEYRRVHQGGVGDRRRRPHPFAAGDRGAVALGQRARRAASPAQRQRSGVRFQGHLAPR
jgi:putative transposase